MKKSSYIYYLVSTTILLYVIGLFLPWKIGVFSIERYDYSEEYQILFLFSILSFFYVFRSWFIKPTSIVICIICGAALGYIASLLAYVLCMLFFYVDGVSLVGLERVLILFNENFLRNTIEFLLYPMLLLGWCYGVLIAITIKFLVKSKEQC